MDWTKNDSAIWHPFTQHANSSLSIPIIKGKGIYLYDINDKKYIDAISSWWVNLFGHAEPNIANAIYKQATTLEHVIFAGFTHQPACTIANELLSILPSTFTKVFFSDNGSTAVEVAIKMAIQYWHNQAIKKTKIIAFENSYHGDTFGAMSVGKSTFFQAFSDLLFDVIKIPIPTQNNIADVKHKFAELVQQNDVACFIFEPLVLGSAGMQMYDAAYLDELLLIAHQHKVITIADEVMTGFGRTGKYFAINYLKETPNIICLSKGITGGFLPLGVSICSEFIYNAFLSSDKTKTLFHGHSYTANPISCSAAFASIQLLKNQFYLVEELCTWQEENMQLLKQHSLLNNIRRTGTIVAFEIKELEADYFSSIRDKLYELFIEQGILLRPLGNTIYIMPPYIIKKEELALIYHIILNTVNNKLC